MSQRPFNQQFPQPGWVEHNPLEIWSTQSFVMENVVNKADIEWSDIEALGITNQRETTVVWDRQTSEPVYNAIVWQDRRTADYCDVLRERGLTERIREKTGLILDAYFSATKIRWILDNVPGARARAERGELCFGTVDSWLAWRLSGGRLHITDVSNASRTMLFDIHTLDWDDELLDLFDIPRSMLPEVVPTSAVYGTTDCPQVPVPIPIASLAGDSRPRFSGSSASPPSRPRRPTARDVSLCSIRATGPTPRPTTCWPPWRGSSAARRPMRSKEASSWAVRSSNGCATG